MRRTVLNIDHPDVQIVREERRKQKLNKLFSSFQEIFISAENVEFFK